jgi:Tol biopolymer transport system component
MFRRALVVAALLAAVAAEPAQATFPGKNGPLMFSSNRNGALDMFCLDPDQYGGGAAPAGSTFTEIAMTSLNTRWNDFAPNWSPDATRVAFHSNRTGDNEIYVFHRASGTTQRLTKAKTDDSYPYWNRMGTQLTFQRADRKGKMDIWLMNADGSGQVNLTNSPGVDERAPVWSPVAREIVYYTDRDGDHEIHRRNLDTNADVKVTNNAIADYAADWSPDGTQFVFSREAGATVETAFGDSQVWAMNVDGSSERLLADRGVTDKQVEWSPDGREIAWVSSMSPNNSASWELFEMNVDGTNLKRLTFNSSGDFQPTYRPDPAVAGS